MPPVPDRPLPELPAPDRPLSAHPAPGPPAHRDPPTGVEASAPADDLPAVPTRGDPGPGLGLVWAQAHGGGIGRWGTVPWYLPEDLAHFRTLTWGHPVVMGRVTWQGLPDAVRPLPGRTNLVLTRRAADPAESVPFPGARAVTWDQVRDRARTERVWVAGGAQIYALAVSEADLAVVTQVDLDVRAHVLAPPLDAHWHAIDRRPAHGWATSTTGLRYRITTWSRT